MHGKTLNALLGYGLDSDLVEKIRLSNYTVSLLRSANKSKLRENFTEEEVETIKAKIDRAPIPEGVLEKILTKSLGCCCYCKDGNAARPFQIHHLVPHSATQDNSETNLVLVCPNHHVAIHGNRISQDEQRNTRWAWYSTVEIAGEYKNKGLVFPFGAFEPLDFSSPAIPGELIEFAPLSPGTSLICYPKGLAAASLEMVRQSGFLLILGRSGSGKSTYAMALAGLQGQEGYSIFRYSYDKTLSSAKVDVATFISLSVRKVVVLLDDTNRWATSDDLQWLAKTVSQQGAVRVVATWTSDDSDDAARLIASDLPKMTLAWEDLKPAVVEVLLQNEAEIVAALQKYEADSFGSLGMGILNSRLQDRIYSLGDRPQTVYEFVFGLRGDAVAVTDEFRRLFDNGRSDIPVLVAAIEQIADFERAVSVEDVIEACKRVTPPPGLPPPTVAWVRAVFDRQIKERRILAVRDHFTTIHRKWASKFIAVGLSKTEPDKTINELVGTCFTSPAEHPERLLRMWSWLRSVKEARPFIRKWRESLTQTDWTELVRICAAKGIMEIGFLADIMHLLSDGPSWAATVNTAFTANEGLITALVHGTTPRTVHWLKELANPVEHASPQLWTRILLSWDRKRVADLLVGLRAEQFDDAWSALNKAVGLCPGWFAEVGAFVPWAEMDRILMSAEPGDVESVCRVFSWTHVILAKIRRSHIRSFGAALTASLQKANLRNLRIPISPTSFSILCFYFPDEAKAALNSLDAKKLGSELSLSLPRDWRKLSMFTLWAEWCGSEIGEEIIKNCDQVGFLKQIKKLGPTCDEFRSLLHFLARGSSIFDTWFTDGLKEVVRETCSGRGEEAKAILGVYVKLDPIAASALASEFNLEPEVVQDAVEKTHNPMREKYHELDALGHDYDLDLT